MTNELHKKLERKNQIVDFFQRGLLSEREFQEAMKTEAIIDHLEQKSEEGMCEGCGKIPLDEHETLCPECHQDLLANQADRWGEQVAEQAKYNN